MYISFILKMKLQVSTNGTVTDRADQHTHKFDGVCAKMKFLSSFDMRYE